MRLSLILVLTILARFTMQHEWKADSKVIQLTGSDLAEKTQTGSWLIMLYAPWCSHCKNLIPTWESLPDVLNEQGVNVAAVNCPDSKPPFCGKAFGDLRGYPTLKFMDADKNLYSYSGNRQKDDLVQFALGAYSSAEKSRLNDEFIIKQDL